jgi:hypothetical protein
MKGKVIVAGASALIALSVLPVVGKAAPTSKHHYTVTQTSFCGSSHSCYPGGNVDLFPAGADDAVTQVGFPWPVSVYGVQYTSAWVSTNGNIQFGVTSSTAQTTYENSSLPSSTLSPKAAIAPYWDDLIFDANANPPQGVYDRETTYRGQSVFVISWRGTEFDGGNPVRFEVIFYQNSPEITFQYLQGDASSATIGIQKTAHGPAVEWSYDSSSVSAGLELDFNWQ